MDERVCVGYICLVLTRPTVERVFEELLGRVWTQPMDGRVDEVIF